MKYVLGIAGVFIAITLLMAICWVPMIYLFGAWGGLFGGVLFLLAFAGIMKVANRKRK